VKTQLNRTVQLRTRFNTLWTSEIHINLKIDAGVAMMSVEECIISVKDSEGSMLVNAHESTV